MTVEISNKEHNIEMLRKNGSVTVISCYECYKVDKTWSDEGYSKMLGIV